MGFCTFLPPFAKTGIDALPANSVIMMFLRLPVNQHHGNQKAQGECDDPARHRYEDR